MREVGQESEFDRGGSFYFRRRDDFESSFGLSIISRAFISARALQSIVGVKLSGGFEIGLIVRFLLLEFSKTW